jgi:hypothetical protein
MHPGSTTGIVVALSLFLGGCGVEPPHESSTPGSSTAEAQDAPTPLDSSFALVREKIEDIPIKTQIEQHVVASRPPSRAALKAEILRRYREASQRRGFRHHNPPTNVYIYVYGSEEQARAGQGLWIGMLARNPGESGTPRVLINDERLAALDQEPEVRFGLSKDERKDVFREVVAAEQRASREAMAEIPDSQFMKQVERERQLGAEYKADLVRQYDLTEEELSEIVVEGVTKGWTR